MTLWTPVYRHDCGSLVGVQVMQSSKLANDACAPDDADNASLQKPTLRTNVEAVHDAGATDGRAIVARVQTDTYLTSAGLEQGWTMGRWSLPFDAAPPVRVRCRAKFSRSIGTKFAVMWWPAGGGWPWEVDFAECFGGRSLYDYWGSRQTIAQRWHGDVNSDGRAIEQLVFDHKVDGTRYNIFDLRITPQRMSIAINGVERAATTDKRYIPDSPGFFALGTALTGRRDAPHTEDAVYVDWVEISKGTEG
jgi:hypothetical protein